MPYTFLKDIEDIRYFYKQGINHFSSLSGAVNLLPLANNPSLQAQVAEEVNQSSESFGFLLRKMIPVMLCSAWESFVDELKDAEPSRYSKHFVKYERWYEESLQEISFIRNCIVHAKGKIDNEYLQKTKRNTFSGLGTKIDFAPPAIDIYFKMFEDAYTNIISNT